MYEHTCGKSQIYISYNLLSVQKLWWSCCNYEAFSNNLSVRWIYTVSHRESVWIKFTAWECLWKRGDSNTREFIDLWSKIISAVGIFFFFLFFTVGFSLLSDCLVSYSDEASFRWMILTQPFTLLWSPWARSLILPPAPWLLNSPWTVIPKGERRRRCHHVDCVTAGTMCSKPFNFLKNLYARQKFLHAVHPHTSCILQLFTIY